MEKPMDSDPFSWDVASVVQRLTVRSSPWTRDVVDLTERIKEHELDGQTLLKYDHYCSRQGLMECLGIRLARHQVALAETLLDWKASSRAYHKWKQAFEKKQAGCSLKVDETEASPSLSPKPNGLPADGEPESPLQKELRERAASIEDNAIENGFDADLDVSLGADIAASVDADPQSSLVQAVHNDHVMSDVQVHSSEETSAELPMPEMQQDAGTPKHGMESPTLEAERPPKRKRVAPMVLIDRPLNIASAFIPTEADTLSFAQSWDHTKEDAVSWDRAPMGAYLGNGSLSAEAILASTGSLSSLLIEPDKDSFASLAPNGIPPGRRISVYRTMKRRLFRKNGEFEKLYKQGIVMRSPSPTESDTVLDLVDLPDSPDSQTMKEMEEEDAEREKAEAEMARANLSPEQVMDILNAAIETMSSTWEEKKREKNQRKAHGLWHDARRKGLRKVRILAAHKQVKKYDDRIKQLCKEISEQLWTKPSEVQNMANCLELSVYDKLYNRWLAQMLESRIEPPRPERVPRPKKPTPKMETGENLGEEILSSSDEEDFVVADDNPEVDLADAMDLFEEPAAPTSPTQSVKSEVPEFLDLTQISWGPNTPARHKTRTFIDLTSPVKPTPSSQPLPPQPTRSIDPGTPTPSAKIALPTPAPEEFGSFREIGDKNPAFWARKPDQWKLLICLVWRLPHSRRVALLDFLRDQSEDEAWEKGVLAHLNGPYESLDQIKDTPSRVSFDVARVYISFVRTKSYAEHLPILFNLPLKIQTKVLECRHPHFSNLWAFLRDAASEFPQDSQVYIATDLDEFSDEFYDDEDLLLEEEEEEEEESQPKSQRPAKEIIQDMDAVDLRERERMRVREQQARREKLRSDLSLLGSMPRDKARLIVNETKREDQPFIYVNPEIGARIKEHQMEGLRFLWNQVVLDPESRQGCLLAHTMGLGKTMQAITLLVVIQEAANSPDPNVRAQIPEELRASQTLVVCPAGLVDNWVDELLIWAPDGVLSEFRRIDAKMKVIERLEALHHWAETGGVLVLGYHMLSNMLSHFPDETSLLDKPTIVIADEAHQMKTPEGKANRACSRFKTRNRIALTGSPLANNVEEYHSMIDWVAPNFLGPLAEFKEIYAQPIQHGLWKDSTGAQKRKALKTLEALKKTVAPKVNRATISSCLKEDLPPKFEFVLFVPPTPIQKRLYDLYVYAMMSEKNASKQAWLMAMRSDLGLICGHPRCFGQKLKEITDPTKTASTRLFPREIIPTALMELRSPDPNLVSLSWKVAVLETILNEARSVGDKVLIFSQSLDSIHYLHNLFQMQRRRVSCLVGTTPINKRQEMTKSFNTGNQEIYLISTTAGGVGLNIHGANRVVIFDFGWNPVIEQQAIGRAYRIGQKKPVYVYTLVVAGSFEEDMHNRHVFKSQLASRVVDKKHPLSWSQRYNCVMHTLKDRAPKNLNPFLGKDSILDKLIQFRKDDQSIQDIISTDTFEEEDPDVTLTELEKRDVDSMVEMNRLRAKDPAAFQAAKWKQDEAEFHRLAEQSRQVNQTAPTGNPQNLQHPGVTLRLNPTGRSTPMQSPVTEVGDWMQRQPPGAYPASQPVPQPAPHYPGPASHTHAPPAGFAPAPLPMAGANTYFGHDAYGAHPPPQTMPPNTMPPNMVPSNAMALHGMPSNTMPPNWVPSNSMPPTPITPGGGSNLFSQPPSRAKVEFQNSLEARIHTLRVCGALEVLGETPHIAHVLTESISEVRKNKGLGFLPDNHHWKDLERLLIHDQFVVCLALNHWTANYVALADMREMENRIKAHEGMPGLVIFDQANRKVHAPDPQNLQNIRRPTPNPGAHTNKSRHAQEDMEVMRQAAENRRRRSSQMPLSSTG